MALEHDHPVVDTNVSTNPRFDKPGTKPVRRYPDALFLLGAAYVAVVAIFFVLHPITWLLSFVPDDAFYYFQIARHIAHGQGSTFDGINPTNGYHPAWMLLMIVLAACIHSLVGLVRAAVLLSFALHIAGSAVLAAFLRRITSRGAGTFIAFTWLINPYAIKIALLSMESMLALLAVAAVMLWRSKMTLDSGNRNCQMRHAALFGLLLAFATYARTDMAIFGLLALATAFVALPRSADNDPGSIRFSAGRVQAVLIAGTVWALCMAPWLLVCHAITGSFVQDSAAMKRLWITTYAQGVPWQDIAKHSGSIMLFEWSGRDIALAVSSLTPKATRFIVIVPGALILLIILGWRAARLREYVWYFVWFGSYFVISGIAFSLSVDYIQLWHVAAATMLLHVIVCLLVYSTFSLVPRPALRYSLFSAVSATMVYFTVAFAVHPIAYYPWQPDVYMSGPVFEQIIPKTSVIGCFNAGIPAYFSPRRIVNLDGLVNHNIDAYWRRHRFNDYLYDANIGYVIDDAPGIERAEPYAGGNLPLSGVESYPLSELPGGRVLTQVVRPRPAGS